MIGIDLQMFGGRGGSSGGNGGGSAQTRAKMTSELKTKIAQNSDGWGVLNSMPVGTRIYDGSKTVTDTYGPWESKTTYWEKTSQPFDTGHWTLFGDTKNYDDRSDFSMFNTLVKSGKNSKFDLKVEYPKKRK